SLSKEAMEECNAAMRLDPGNFQFRSCSSAFYWTKQFDRARDFINLDAGSEWSNNVGTRLLLSEGKTKEALEEMHKLPESPFFHTRALEACYSVPRPPGSEQLLQQAAKEFSTFRDPEPRYVHAGLFNHCLGNDFTARLVESAIQGGFCSYDYL